MVSARFLNHGVWGSLGRSFIAGFLSGLPYARVPVSGLGFRVCGLGFRAYGLQGFRGFLCSKVWGFGVKGFRVKIQGFRVQGFGSGVQGFGFMGFRALGFQGFRALGFQGLPLLEGSVTRVRVLGVLQGFLSGTSLRVSSGKVPSRIYGSICWARGFRLSRRAGLRVYPERTYPLAPQLRRYGLNFLVILRRT